MWLLIGQLLAIQPWRGIKGIFVERVSTWVSTSRVHPAKGFHFKSWS
jgi:hypothetical protein